MVSFVVNERVLEARGTLLLGLTLVDDDVLAHEVQVATSVRVRVARGDQGAVPSVEPYFDQILALLFEIVRLEVVDDGKVVNVAPA